MLPLAGSLSWALRALWRGQSPTAVSRASRSLMARAASVILPLARPILPAPGESGVGVLGSSDCEAVRDGVLAQPVAAVSSLAFVAGAVVVWRMGRGDSAGSSGVLWYAGTMGCVGLSSAWYHGPQGSGAALAHDASIALLLAQAVSVPVVRLARKAPWSRGRAARVPAKAAVGLLVAAGTAYALGRTGSPVCRPTSVVQLHGLWHVLAAGAFTAWGMTIWPPRQAA